MSVLSPLRPGQAFFAGALAGVFLAVEVVFFVVALAVVLVLVRTAFAAATGLRTVLPATFAVATSTASASPSAAFMIAAICAMSRLLRRATLFLWRIPFSAALSRELTAVMSCAVSSEAAAVPDTGHHKRNASPCRIPSQDERRDWPEDPYQ